MSDLIDRQAAIDALYNWSEHSMTDAEAWHIRQVIGDIKSLPPAEPNCSEIPNNSDCISRQAAIEVIDAVFPVDSMKSEYAQGIACGAALAKTYIEQLPSAQPEVIRCKDCKWKQGSECVRFADVRPFPDDYCSRAERKEA